MRKVSDEQNAFRTEKQESSDFADLACVVLKSVVARLNGQTRVGQEQMVCAVANALENSGHLIVQAGTGTGKSFAYLVPALLWCARNDRRLIVSTATLALQRQIMAHDAPLVADVVGKTVGRTPKVALLKGWNNYVCLRKASGGYPEEGALLSRMEAEYGSMSGTATGEEVMRVREWAMTSLTGDRDDLVPGVSDRVWEQVSVPKRECVGETCPLRDSCFPLLTRYNSEKADLVVTNHSMLAVASSGTPVLPPTDAYVIDEAHVLVERVTSQLTVSLNKFDVSSVARLLRRSGLDDVLLDNSADELESALEELSEERLTHIPADLNEAVARLLGRVQEALGSVEAMKPGSEDKAVARQILRARLTDIADVCEQLLGSVLIGGSLVVWSAQIGESSHGLYVAPIDVSTAIAREIFQETPAVLTSATAKIGGVFDTIAHRVGLDKNECGPWAGLDVGTPFDHVKQAILYVAAHLPVPGREGYGEETLKEMRELIEASGGGALVLCTSRAAAERAANYMRSCSHLPVLCQGDDQLPTLIENFANNDAACLFGTMALWQGVDVPGRTLRLVIIDRIPFPRPNEPLTDARLEAVSRMGGNGFMEVTCAQAALLLAQGAGRLLRRIDDRGVVAVLDPRLCTKRYSGFLLASMPQMWRTTDRVVVREALKRLNSDITFE